MYGTYFLAPTDVTAVTLVSDYTQILAISGAGYHEGIMVGYHEGDGSSFMSIKQRAIHLLH